MDDKIFKYYDENNKINNCFLDSLDNDHIPDSFVVFGSLAIGTKNPITEYGNEKSDNIEDFIKQNGINGHFWRQNKEGRIFDRAREIFFKVAHFWGKKIKLTLDSSIYNMSNEDLKKKGLYYYPASENVQNKVFKFMLNSIKSYKKSN